MKKTLLIMMLFVFVVSFSSSAHATSFQPPSVIIKCHINDSLFQQNLTCLNDDCTTNISKTPYGDFYLLNLPAIANEDANASIRTFAEILLTEDGIRYRAPYSEALRNQIHQQFLSVLGSICMENVNDVKSVFSEEVERWVYSPEYGHRAELFFEPYSAERGLEIKESYLNYGNCIYEDYDTTENGNWLIGAKKMRDYCYTISDYPFGHTMLSYGNFFGFLIANPDANAIPYLLAYLIPLALFLALVIYLIARKELEIFFKPNKINVGLTVVLGLLTHILIMVFSGFTSILITAAELLIISIISCYILGSLIKYIYDKAKKSEKRR